MRCFTFENGQIEQGFRFHGLNGIKVGDQLLTFDESLLFNPGSHFGQHIVRASLTKHGERLSLAAPRESDDENGGVLLLIRALVSQDSEITYECTGGAEPIIGQRCSRVVYGSDNRSRFKADIWEALIQFHKGGEVSLSERITKRQGFLEVLLSFDSNEVLTRSFYFLFNGEDISISRSEPEGSQPKYRQLRLGMYDEAETIYLIAEMIGNQDRFNR